MSGQANRTSSEVIQRWWRAMQRLERAKSDVTKAECELHNAANDAGKHLAPPDAEIGEEFQMWLRTDELGFVEKERIVVVRKTDAQSYTLGWRKPKGTVAPSTAIPKDSSLDADLRRVVEFVASWLGLYAHHVNVEEGDYLRCLRCSGESVQHGRDLTPADVAHDKGCPVALATEILPALSRTSIPAWQPIKTAPKDSRLLILFCAAPSDYKPNLANGLIWLGGYFGKATHWMPLPAPPITQVAPIPAESDVVVDEVQRRMDAVVDAAVECYQSEENGFEKSIVLDEAVRSLLELRSTPITQAEGGPQITTVPDESSVQHEFSKCSDLYCSICANGEPESVSSESSLPGQSGGGEKPTGQYSVAEIEALLTSLRLDFIFHGPKVVRQLLKEREQLLIDYTKLESERTAQR